jgi:hypothetical protein
MGVAKTTGAPDELKIWVPFEVMRRICTLPTQNYGQRDASSPLSCVCTAFSSLEKATEAYPCTVSHQYVYAPYRLYKCGNPDVVYIYVHGANSITITNVAEDLWDLARAMPAHYCSITSMAEVYKLACAIDGEVYTNDE